MNLQPFDFESSLETIGNFVQAVVLGQDKNKKIKLVEELQQLLEMANNSNKARKKFKSFDLKVPEKKIKVDCEKAKLPNEIWTKIMNFCLQKTFLRILDLFLKDFMD